MSGKYLVVLKDHVTNDQIVKLAEEVTQSGGQVGQKFQSSIMKGFAAELDDAQLQSLQSLQSDVIEYIEPDSVVTTK